MMDESMGPSAVLAPSRRTLIFHSLALMASTIYLTPLFAKDSEPLDFNALYKSFGIRGLEFSDRAQQLAGHVIFMTGYMAPPLRAESQFFVLTKEPLAICPFCQSDADWPVDIVVVYLKGVSPLISAGTQITVSGRLEMGSWADPESGFVSQVRLVDAEYHRA